MLKSNYITEEIIVKGFNEKLLNSISHDLTISTIQNVYTKKEYEKYMLEPKENVMIACEQVVNLPHDRVAIVSDRNSLLRQGLLITAPIYQPGHHSRIFFRLTNAGPESVNLKRGDNIAQLFLDVAVGDEELTYNGKYQNELKLK